MHREREKASYGRTFFSDLTYKMKKLKALKPSLREKKRYLAFEVISDDKISKNGLKSAIKGSLRTFIGDLGSAGAGIIILKDKIKNNKGIIKVNNNYINELKASLTFINNINGNNVLLRSLETSGILKKAERCL